MWQIKLAIRHHQLYSIVSYSFLTLRLSTLFCSLTHATLRYASMH